MQNLLIELALLLKILSNTVAQVPEVTAETKNFYTIEASVSAYTADPLETDDEPLISASGHVVFERMAACPNFLKFGAAIEIDYERYYCYDRMARRFRESKDPYYIDIFMWDKDNALKFGRSTRTVKIFK